MIKSSDNFAFLRKLLGKRPSKAQLIAVPRGERSSSRITHHVSRPQFPSYSFFVPPWMFWIAMLLLAPHALFGEERVDRSLVPSIFAPESTPAHSISHLAGFVLSITGVMFVLVAGLLTYAIIRYRRRANDDGMEPAQVYGSGPVEAAWTTVPFLIVVVLTLSTARVIQSHPGDSGRAQTGISIGRADHRQAMVVGDSVSQTRHRNR
jgi:hypothetical protein